MVVVDLESSRLLDLQRPKSLKLPSSPLYAQVGNSFMSYAGGIYTPPPSDCAPPYCLNHFMLIVGYDNVNKYWLVKNSWGMIWGQNKGVMKVREEGRQGR